MLQNEQLQYELKSTQELLKASRDDLEASQNEVINLKIWSKGIWSDFMKAKNKIQIKKELKTVETQTH